MEKTTGDEMREDGTSRFMVPSHKWGDGPWMGEGHRAEWRDEATGLDCLAVRNSSGAWCGYVAVPPSHPLHGTEYGEIELSIDVHGGLTYSDACQGHICHVPRPGEPENVWWFGFDCNHANDLAPATEAYFRRSSSSQSLPWHRVYRTLDYVKGECARLARQLAESR